jgi:hypothetical protein
MAVQEYEWTFESEDQCEAFIRLVLLKKRDDWLVIRQSPLSVVMNNQALQWMAQFFQLGWREGEKKK